MKTFTDGLQGLGIPYQREKAERLYRYMEGILEWNQKVNLTAITEREAFAVKHLLDSLLCLGFKEYQQAKTVIDVGTGAGFPGVPLAVFSADKEFTLVDSLQKRLKIIDQLTASIGIGNVKTIHGRAEELAKKKEFREAYDLCVSRAVANLTVLTEYCLPFVKPGGYFLAYKGPGSEEEIKEASKALEILGGKVERIETGPVSELALEHKILVIKKFRPTPSKYPRKAGTPAKEPLK